MRDAGDKSYRAGITIATLALMIASAVLTAQPPTAPTTTADVSVADKVAWLAGNSVTLRSINPHDEDFADLRPLARSIGDARIVLLGGSREAAAVNAKDRLVRFLHQEMGFDVLASSTNLFDAEEFYRALVDGRVSPRADIEQGFGIQLPSSLPQGPARWVNRMPTQPDILDYALATHKTGRPLHIAYLGSLVSAFLRTDYARRLFQLVDRIDPHLALPADRKAIQSLLNFITRAGPAGSTQWDKLLPPGLEAITRLYDGLGRLPPNSPDAPEISFYRYTLASLGFYASIKAGRPLQVQPKDPLAWTAKTWRPQSKIVVWSSNQIATRMAPVCREFGNAVYTIAFSEIKDDNGVLEVLPAGPQPSLAPVEGDLESLLHAVGKPYSFVDFRSLPQNHWLRQPLAARLIPAPAITSWPTMFDGLLVIDLAALKDKKK
jgi:erythromycin esterase-like protein